MEDHISAVTALGAGMLSFLSPCVLPLVSSYMLLITGVHLRDAEVSGAEEAGRTEGWAQHSAVILSTMSFIAGFTVIFIILSVLFYGALSLLGGINRIIQGVSGIVIIILGLHLLFNFIPFLNYEKRFSVSSKHSGITGAFLAGLAFGAGWTPCVGPILGAILLMAGQSGQMALAVLYLLLYSLGLGLPFLLAAIFWGKFLRWLSTLKPLIRGLHLLSGLLLICLGVLMFLDRFILLNALLFKTGYGLAKWAKSGSPGVRLIPAVIFLTLGLLPVLLRAVQGKAVLPKLPLLVFCLLLLSLGVLSLLGVVNSAALFSQWLVFIGI
jgi:cytochrome c-type biogenesis protein